MSGNSAQTPPSQRFTQGDRPRLLDLFCGSFGAGEGYRRAGFDVTGVDLVERPRPDGVTFIQGDALAFLAEHGDDFEAVHASPPCHDFTVIRPPADGTEHLLHDTLAALAPRSQPWVVENVEGARRVMPGALTLCGTEFGLGATCADGVYRHLKRHRLFMSNAFLFGAGGCNCSGRLIAGIYGSGGEENCATRRAAAGQTGGGYKLGVGPARQAMDMPWADRQGVSLAIPPAYTGFIGRQLLSVVAERRAA